GLKSEDLRAGEKYQSRSSRICDDLGFQFRWPLRNHDPDVKRSTQTPGFFRPVGAESPSAFYPRLAPWALFCRRFAADGQSFTINAGDLSLLRCIDRAGLCPE